MAAKSINRILQAQSDIRRRNSQYGVTVKAVDRTPRHLGITPDDTHRPYTAQILRETITSAAPGLNTAEQNAIVRFAINCIRRPSLAYTGHNRRVFCDGTITVSVRRTS